jgi:hypothetical protein
MSKGRRPKSAHLRLVTGTHRDDRHGDAVTAREAAEKCVADFGPLIRPKYLKRFALDAWKRYIEPAHWLDASREPAAIAFCELWQEMRLASTNFQAARHSQMRSYMAALGLTDERNRVVEVSPEKDEFFDD